MNNETIPQSMMKEVVSALRVYATGSWAAVERAKDIVERLDALSAPKDPAEVAIWRIVEGWIRPWMAHGIPPQADADKVGQNMLSYIRAAYADHFKQDAERDKAVKALSDYVRRACGDNIGCNNEVRRLYGWDKP